MKEFPYGVKSPHDVPEIADGILDEYFAVTAQLGIPAAIILGACLGLVRDGAYPPGDNDIDVVAVVDDLDRAYLTKKLIALGYLVGRTFPANNTHFVKDGILLDLYWRQSDGFYSEFESVEYRGKRYPVPAPVDVYLTTCYGDWKTPDPDQGSVYEG
jgi:phosphorylcholine metabolism protein LicD